jgi:ABC-type transport system substrate-binding protein
MKNVFLIIIAMLSILAVTVVPTYGWVIPPNPAGEDNKYEMYGPHVNGIIIKIYADTTSEWNDMAAGQLDLEDWVLDSHHVTLWSTPGGPITEANCGGEAGYYILDINNNATLTPYDSTLGVHNPTSELILRQAIAYCVNRSYAAKFTGGLASPIYTPMPTYMTGYINPDIAPGKPLQALTYSDLRNLPASAGNCNLEAANALLDANGYTIDSNGWRIDPVSQGGTGAELNLIFYSRFLGDRRTISDDIKANLNAIHINVNYQIWSTRTQLYPVLAQEYFNLYVGGWTGIGPDSDYLCDLYNGSNYYHPGSPPNYDGINYPNVNGNATIIKLTPTIAAGIQATLDFQVAFAQEAAAVPIWCYSGFKSFKNVPVEGGGNWTHIVNQQGSGVNSWWSTLDMQTNANLYPNLNAYYGFSETIVTQNMVYAVWYWDMEVLGRIYDGGAARDPYTIASWVPQLYKNWTIGSWIDPVTHQNKTSVTVTLRPDVYWQDGYPFTVADVYYTLVEISKDLLAKGFPPPSWYPTVQYMRSVQIVDSYTIQILLDVQSVWAAGWVIGSVIIPKHIWKPIVDSSINDGVHNYVQGITPDANIIGTGPFRWVSGLGDTVGSTVVLAANTLGSVINGITSPGYYLYEPVYADINPPNGQSKINVLRTDPSVVVPVTLTLRNLWTDGSLVVSKYLYVNGVLQPGFPVNKALAPVTPYPLGTSDNETVTLTLAKKTLTFVELAVQIQTAPWTGQWVNVTLPVWVTIKQDIGGTTLYDVMGYASYPGYLKNEAPAPDLKADVRDISLAAKAFGTVPGSPAWNTVADLNGDFKIDMKDIANIAKQFGY